MPKEFGQIPPQRLLELKEDTFAPWEKNLPMFSVPKKADVFVTPLRSNKNSSIFKSMAEGSSELGVPQVQETIKPQDPQREVRKTPDQEPSNGIRLSEEELLAQQQEAGENLEALLAELRAEGEIDFEVMNHDELEKALGKKLTNEHQGSMKHVYDVEGRPDVVAKIDRSIVEPEDQEVEHDLNKFLHSFAPDQIPETLETLQVEKDGKRASLTYTKKVNLAPHGTEATPGKTNKDLKERFKTVGLHRFLDSNIGNGIEDERTGTNHAHEVNAETNAEVYFDDSGELIVSDVLQSRGNIERFVDGNIGKLYSREGAQNVRNTLDYLQNKYDPEFKKNPEYKAQKDNQKLVAA